MVQICYMLRSHRRYCAEFVCLDMSAYSCFFKGRRVNILQLAKLLDIAEILSCRSHVRSHL